MTDAQKKEGRSWKLLRGFGTWLVGVCVVVLLTLIVVNNFLTPEEIDPSQVLGKTDLRWYHKPAALVGLDYYAETDITDYRLITVATIKLANKEVKFIPVFGKWKRWREVMIDA